MTRSKMIGTTIGALAPMVLFIPILAACENLASAPADDDAAAVLAAVRAVTEVKPTEVRYQDFPPGVGESAASLIEAYDWKTWSRQDYWGEELERLAVERGDALPEQIAYYLTLRFAGHTDGEEYLFEFEGLRRMSDGSGHGTDGKITVNSTQGVWESDVVVRGYANISWEGPVR